MTTANHMLTGALIGTVIHQPVLGLSIALLSHFALDALPHFGFSSWAERAKHKKLLYIVLSIDALMVLITIFAILANGSGWLVVACAVAAVSPDFAWVYRYVAQEKFGKLEPRKGNWLTEFHSGIQTREFPNGFIIEYLVFAGLLTTFIKVG